MTMLITALERASEARKFMASQMKHINATPWRVERWRGGGGQSGISIHDAEGHALLNMIGQIRENQYALAKHIVKCVNAATLKARGTP